MRRARRNRARRTDEADEADEAVGARVSLAAPARCCTPTFLMGRAYLILASHISPRIRARVTPEISLWSLTRRVIAVETPRFRPARMRRGAVGATCLPRRAAVGRGPAHAARTAERGRRAEGRSSACTAPVS